MTSNQCNKCLAGRLRVITSKRVGDSQQQRVECLKCGRKSWRTVPRDAVWPRQKKVKIGSTLETLVD